MRIASLLPSATEIIYALGLQDDLVGVSHECDYPPEARSRPVLIESALGADAAKLPPDRIDALIRETTGRGESMYRFKPGALEQANPTLVVTQGLCDVCAMPFNFVVKEISRLKLKPDLISLDPGDLTGILTDIRRVGEATGQIDKAGEVVDALEERVGEVAGRTRDLAAGKRPRVAVIEWTAPLYAAGHWVPEMVELAGGVDVLAVPAQKSQTVEWTKILEARPEVIVVAPCGYDLPRAQAALARLRELPGWPKLPAVERKQVYVMDANATLSRSGPRIVDGLEVLARIIHPEIFSEQKCEALWAPAF